MAVSPSYNNNWIDYRIGQARKRTNFRPTTWNSTLTDRPTFSSLGPKPMYTASPQQLAAARANQVVKGVPNWALLAAAAFVIIA